MLKKCR